MVSVCDVACALTKVTFLTHCRSFCQAIGALGGGAVSLFQTSWYPDADLYGHKGAKVADPVTFSKMFRSVPIFRGPFFGTVMLCGMFASIECLLESLRGPARPSPWINSGIAGMATGAVLGLFTKRYGKC